MNDPSGFVPPPYPYDRLDRLVPLAKALAGGIWTWSEVMT